MSDSGAGQDGPFLEWGSDDQVMEWGPDAPSLSAPEPYFESDDYEISFEDEPRVPRRLDEWRKRTATGALASAVALGLQQVFDPEKKTTVPIEQVVPDKPIDPGRIELKFDPMDSQGSQVVIHVSDD